MPRWPKKKVVALVPKPPPDPEHARGQRIYKAIALPDDEKFRICLAFVHEMQAAPPEERAAVLLQARGILEALALGSLADVMAHPKTAAKTRIKAAEVALGIASRASAPSVSQVQVQLLQTLGGVRSEAPMIDADLVRAQNDVAWLDGVDEPPPEDSLPEDSPPRSPIGAPPAPPGRGA